MCARNGACLKLEKKLCRRSFGQRRIEARKTPWGRKHRHSEALLLTVLHLARTAHQLKYASHGCDRCGPFSRNIAKAVGLCSFSFLFVLLSMTAQVGGRISHSCCTVPEWAKKGAYKFMKLLEWCGCFYFCAWNRWSMTCMSLCSKQGPVTSFLQDLIHLQSSWPLTWQQVELPQSRRLRAADLWMMTGSIQDITS